MHALIILKNLIEGEGLVEEERRQVMEGGH
jgi:hypothetical protein